MPTYYVASSEIGWVLLRILDCESSDQSWFYNGYGYTAKENRAYKKQTKSEKENKILSHISQTLGNFGL